MNQVQTFGFGILPVRVVELEGRPWFVALDVATALGFTVDNLKYHAKQSFTTAEKRVVKLPGFRGTGALCLSESGLYKLGMRSNKPGAKTFQNWVTQVVLPAIRKDGAYVMGEEKVATGELSEDELVMRAMTIMSKKVERLTQERDQLASVSSAQAAHIERIQPAAQVGQVSPYRPACVTYSPPREACLS